MIFPGVESPALLDPEPSIALPDLEQAIALRLRLVGLNTIRRRILAFGALATLIPSLITGTISYFGNRRTLTEKTTDQLNVANSSIELANTSLTAVETALAGAQ